MNTHTYNPFICELPFATLFYTWLKKSNSIIIESSNYIGNDGACSSSLAIRGASKRVKLRQHYSIAPSKCGRVELGLAIDFDDPVREGVKLLVQIIQDHGVCGAFHIQHRSS